MFKKDPLTALGISPDAEMSSDVHMRKNEIVKDVENRSSTFKQWVTVQNLFLVSVIITLMSESAVGSVAFHSPQGSLDLVGLFDDSRHGDSSTRVLPSGPRPGMSSPVALRRRGFFRRRALPVENPPFTALSMALLSMLLQEAVNVSLLQTLLSLSAP